MEVSDQNFEQEVMKSDLPVLVDFFAEWCGPCKMQASIIEDLEKEYQGKVKIVKMDIDQASQIAGSYQIMSIPTIILFKNGEPAERLSGLQQKNILKEKLDKLIEH
ncbi:thioredoxin [Patescibacteria group bacterium]|nr:thioredoxin [Patescibacteria group bacterium]